MTEEMQKAWTDFERHIREKIEEYMKTGREAPARGMEAALAILTLLTEPKETEEPPIILATEVIARLAGAATLEATCDALTIFERSLHSSKEPENLEELPNLAIDDFQVAFATTLSSFKTACGLYPTLTLGKLCE